MKFETLKQYEAGGLISMRKHPQHPLWIVKYTKPCFFKRMWDDVTLECRGHVYDEFGNCVSRPFQKVFNLDEHESTQEDLIKAKMRNLRWTATDKLNGHLMIVFGYMGEIINTTSGSFESDYVYPDRMLLEETADMDELREIVDNNFTLMFEVISDYDPHTLTSEYKKRGLENTVVLIGARHVNTGYMVPHNTLMDFAKLLGCPCAEAFDFSSLKNPSSLLEHQRTEGYVFQFSDGSAVKIKTYDYSEKRRQYYGVNGSFLKKLFKRHYLDVHAALEHLEEENHFLYEKVVAKFDQWENEIVQRYRGIADNIIKILGIDAPRKEVAKHVYMLKMDGIDKSALMDVFNYGTINSRKTKKWFMDEFDFSLEGEVDFKEMWG